MADGEITVKLTLRLGEPALRHLREGAEKLGLSVEDYASEIIEQQLSDDDDWADADQALEEYDRTGVSFSLEEGMAAFDAAIEVELKNPR